MKRKPKLTMARISGDQSSAAHPNDASQMNDASVNGHKSPPGLGLEAVPDAEQTRPHSKALANQADVDHPPTLPEVIHIAQSEVQAKWQYLDEKSQDAVRVVFESTMQETLSRGTKENPRPKTETSVHMAMASLNKRLPKMPFPPGVEARDFDEAGLTETNVCLLLR